MRLEWRRIRGRCRVSRPVGRLKPAFQSSRRIRLVMEAVQVRDEVAHVGVVDTRLGLRLPGGVRRGVVREDADDVDRADILESRLQHRRVATEHEMEELRHEWTRAWGTRCGRTLAVATANAMMAVACGHRWPAAERSPAGRPQAARRVAATMRERTRAMSRSASSPVAASA